MFVYNVKVNSKKLFKLIFCLMIALGIVFCAITVSKVIFKNGSKPASEVYQITPNNYTNVLSSVHDDIDTYVRTENWVFRIYI